MKRAVFLERKVLRMWVVGKGRRGGERSGVGALTGRGADRPGRGRVIEMCFYSGGEKTVEGGKKTSRREENERSMREASRCRN